MLSNKTSNGLKQNSKNKKNGGPYTKNNKDKRRGEVYRLHFEYGYSARKISELMEINRNTINADIDYWYSKITKKFNVFRPEDKIITTLEKMDIQLARLREHLDKAKSISEKIAIERLIYDINSKMIYIHQKLLSSVIRNYESSVKMCNEILKKNKLPNRQVSPFDTISVSEKAREKIDKIIDEDKNTGNLR